MTANVGMKALSGKLEESKTKNKKFSDTNWVVCLENEGKDVHEHK